MQLTTVRTLAAPKPAGCTRPIVLLTGSRAPLMAGFQPLVILDGRNTKLSARAGRTGFSRRLGTGSRKQHLGPVLCRIDLNGAAAAALQPAVELRHQPLLLHHIQPLPEHVLVDALYQLDLCAARGIQ